MNKQLYLVTETFPYGTGEKTFILPELDELTKNYDVTIISHASKAVLNDKVNETKLDGRIKNVNIDINLKWYKKILYLIRFFVDQDGIRELKCIFSAKKKIFTRIYQSIGFYALAMENYALMRKKGLLHFDIETIYYTYWYFYYTYSMTKNKAKFSKVKIVTRAHGFDLYSEEYKGNRQPFKEIMDMKLDRVFFISDQGRDYYFREYDIKDRNKYVVSRLGTIGEDREHSQLKRSNSKFRIVSCSSVIPLKRVELIVEALSLLDEPIEWIHFGTGSENDKITELAEQLLRPKENISYRLMGYVPNDKVKEYYRTNYVDCFISTSRSEGLPVSIQEAMAFGIPIIATDVGGVSELVENNGILLKDNPTKEEIVQALKKIFYMSDLEYNSLRENSYKNWLCKYNAVTNRTKFIAMLEEQGERVVIL